jgi:GDPmannose 4,6-dehydratase
MYKLLYKQKKIDTIDILNIDRAKDISENKKCIIITGVTGQDGSLMVDYLLKNTNNYIIFGGVRRLSIYNHKNIKHVNSDRFFLINFDLTDSHTICRIFDKLKPCYFINFASQSYVGSSWDFPEQTWNCNSSSIIHILEGIKEYCPNCKLYHAGSSEEFGETIYTPQNESHPLNPSNPYGASKVASRVLIKTWRKAYNLFIMQGWLFNHESIRRGEEFVTRKITKNVAYIDYCIKFNFQIQPFYVGNINAQRDWSDAEDIIDGIWKSLNNSQPKDYVLASGKSHTVREFITQAFKVVNIHGYWENNTNDELNETFYAFIFDKKTILVKIDENFYRPVDTNLSVGDPTLAKKELNWESKNNLDNLIKKMVEYDCNQLLDYDKKR